MPKSIDIVKPEPRTSLEAWSRWLNQMTSSFMQMPYSTRRKIYVTQIHESNRVEVRK